MASDVLEATSIFAALPAQARDELAAGAAIEEVAAGETLFEAGEPADALYVVDTGSFEVIADVDGEPRTLRTLSRGAVAGELGALAGAPRSATVRARRDATAVRVDAERLRVMMAADPELSNAVIRSLAAQLQASAPLRPAGSQRPRVIAVLPGSPGAPGRQVMRAIAELMRRSGDEVDELEPEVPRDTALETRRHLARIVSSHERAADAVLVAAEAAPGIGGDAAAWAEACVLEADRVVVVLEVGAAAPPALEGVVTDLVVVGGSPPLERLKEWLRALAPRSHWSVADPSRTDELAPLARSLAGRSPAVVLSGGGARGFAHVGMLEELDAAGITVDRYAGTSMGAFVGALAAHGMSPGEIHERLREEFVSRNPLGDMTVPVIAMSRGGRGLEMVERAFGELEFEQLERPYFCVSVDITAGEEVVHDTGWLAGAVGASMSIPGFLPPVPLGDRRLVDGGMLNNFPVDHMLPRADGPVIGCDVFAGFESSAKDAAGPWIPWSGGGGGITGLAAKVPGIGFQVLERGVRRALSPFDERLPTLPEVLGRVVTLPGRHSSERNGELADFLVRPHVSDVGVFEFERLDELVERGRTATRAALEEGAVPFEAAP